MRALVIKDFLPVTITTDALAPIFWQGMAALIKCPLVIEGHSFGGVSQFNQLIPALWDAGPQLTKLIDKLPMQYCMMNWTYC